MFFRLVIYLFFIVLINSPHPSLAITGGGEGESFGNEILSIYGDGNKLNERASKPITSDNTLMTTVDGSKSFNATVLCPSTKSYLRVRVIPQNGGEGKILIDQDTDVNGVFDYSADAGVFSGVCSNGFITCQPGTWQSCIGKRWVADPVTKKIGLEGVGIGQLSNCTCTNNSCGNALLYTNAEIVLSQIGAGITFAIHKVDQTISIAKADYDASNLQAIFYAQRLSSCSDINTGPGSGNIGQYYNNPAALSNDGTQSYNNLSPSSDNDIYYYATKGDYVKSSVQYRNCSVNRIANVITNTLTELYSHWGNDIVRGIDHYATAVIKKENNTIKLILYGRNPAGGIQPADAIYTITEKTYSDEYSIASANATTQTEAGTGGCWSGVYNGSLPSIGDEKGVSGICGGKGTQYIYFRYDLYINLKKDTLSQTISDGCSNLDSDPNCVLLSEKTDGIDTVKNQIITGLIPLPSCKSFTGEVKVFDLCQDWWKKDRTYKCKTTPSEDLDAGTKARVVEVSNSTKYNSGSMSYTDTYAKDVSGASITYNTTAEIGFSPKNETCAKGCKIRKPKTNTQANSFGNATQYQKQPTTYEFKFLKCNESNGVSVCPVQAGEEILKDCQCLNEFAETVTAISIVNEAAKGLICSSGNKQ